jgi:glucosamine-6-phosphate deaminase
MSIRQIMSSREIICAAPDLRKAEAVRRCLDGPVSEEAPASILQQHPNCTILLDPASASLLNPNRQR